VSDPLHTPASEARALNHTRSLIHSSGLSRSAAAAICVRDNNASNSSVAPSQTPSTCCRLHRKRKRFGVTAATSLGAWRHHRVTSPEVIHRGNVDDGRRPQTRGRRARRCGGGGGATERRMRRRSNYSAVAADFQISARTVRRRWYISTTSVAAADDEPCLRTRRTRTTRPG